LKEEFPATWISAVLWRCHVERSETFLTVLLRIAAKLQLRYAQNEIRRSLGESRGYDPHAARRRYYAAIARLAGRHEMIVAARDKKQA
jgi:hypothetical protein